MYICMVTHCEDQFEFYTMGVWTFWEREDVLANPHFLTHVFWSLSCDD